MAQLSRVSIVGYFSVPQFLYEFEDFFRIRMLSYCVISIHFTLIYLAATFCYFQGIEPATFCFMLDKITANDISADVVRMWRSGYLLPRKCGTFL